MLRQSVRCRAFGRLDLHEAEWRPPQREPNLFFKPEKAIAIYSVLQFVCRPTHFVNFTSNVLETFEQAATHSLANFRIVQVVSYHQSLLNPGNIICHKDAGITGQNFQRGVK